MLRRSDSLQAEFMEEMRYLTADMIIWLDETGSSENRNLVTICEESLPANTSCQYEGKDYPVLQ